MGETLVIGYGNTLRGDDAAGLRVAAAVARWRLPGVRVLAPHQLAPELAADLHRAARAVFVDAAPAAVVPTVALRPLVAGMSPGGPSPLGHAVTPDEVLALCRALYDRTPEAWHLLVPAEEFGVGEPLSPCARRGVRHSVRALRRFLAGESVAMAATGAIETEGRTSRSA